MNAELQKHESFIEQKNSIRLAPGKEGVKTSAMLIDLHKLDVREEITANMQFQLHEHKYYGVFDDVTELNSNKPAKSVPIKSPELVTDNGIPF
jgi:hypothetical protein